MVLTLLRELLTISVYSLVSCLLDRPEIYPSIRSSTSGAPVALLCPVIREAKIGGCVLAGMCERERECVSMCVGGACACQWGVLTLQGQGRSSHVSVWRQNVLFLNHLVASDSQCEQQLWRWVLLVFACLSFLRVDIISTLPFQQVLLISGYLCSAEWDHASTASTWHLPAPQCISSATPVHRTRESGAQFLFFLFFS